MVINMSESVQKEKKISWRMYAAGYFITFVLFLMQLYNPNLPIGSIIAAALISIPCALFLCSGWNAIHKNPRKINKTKEVK